jgi:hypothetical protein
VSDLVLNIVVGLATAALSGASIWIWERGRRLRWHRRRADFFGFDGSQSLIILNDNPRAKGTMAHDDIAAAIEIASYSRLLGVEPNVIHYSHVGALFGTVTEFCLGGPDANPRTTAHLNNYFADVSHDPFDPDYKNPDALAINVGDRKYRRVPGQEDHVLLAKFYPGDTHRPIFLIDGQTAAANRGAAFYMVHNVDRLLKDYPRHFCLMLRIRSPRIYGYRSVERVADLTPIVFRTSEASQAPMR